jgi:hypothetical protein
MASEDFHGSCICGSVKYEISGEPRAFYHCHCERCRKASGTGHASTIILKPDTVTWTEGEDLLGTFKVPDAERFRTAFCTNCGSPMPRITPDFSMAVIPAGSLDSANELGPAARIMLDYRAAWSCDGSALPGWAQYPG